jgi:hypothetical protein
MVMVIGIVLDRVQRPSYTQRPMRKMRVAIPAVDEHEIADSPADRTEGLFLHGAIVKQQGDMLRELPPP